MDVLAQESGGSVGIEGQVAGEHLIHHHPQRVDVRPCVQLSASHSIGLLARHVCRRAHYHSGLRLRIRFPQLGNAEVHHLNDDFAFVPARQEDVVGFEVAMNDAQPVGGIQAPARLQQDFRNFGDWQRSPAVKELAQRFTFEVFHGDVRRAIVALGGFVNGDDVEMMDAPRGPRLILEAHQKIGIVEKLAVENLNRHQAVSHSKLLGQKNRAHSPFAQAPEDAKVARNSGGKLCVDCCDRRGEARAILQTKSRVVGKRLLAYGTGFHGRQVITGMGRILAEVPPRWEPPRIGSLDLGEACTDTSRMKVGAVWCLTILAALNICVESARPQQSITPASEPRPESLLTPAEIAIYKNAQTLIDWTPTEIRHSPYLHNLVEAGGVDRLPEVLDRAGKTVTDLLNDFPQVSCDEELDSDAGLKLHPHKDHSVWTSPFLAHQEFRYIILLRPMGDVPAVEEYRTDLSGNAVDVAGLSGFLMVTANFASTILNLSRSTSPKADSETLDARPFEIATVMLGFAQDPEKNASGRPSLLLPEAKARAFWSKGWHGSTPKPFRFCEWSPGFWRPGRISGLRP